MKITIDRSGDGVHTTIEREPMPPERFEVVCKLVGLAIGGAVLLGAVHMVGIWAIAWAVGALVATGLYSNHG
ncbi:MAG: hypothetical protein HDT15_11410 [Oscillibacter sp.]|nr:hypothetical protein [Oscillibacter sp.]MBD5155631.1 hypothetical protein [Oscillibacter sp.]